MKRIWFACILLGLTAGAWGAAVVTVPLNYQGQLSDPTGLPLSGSQNMSFIIYDASSGGNQIWSSAASSVTVNNGLFSVDFSVGLSSTAMVNSPMWLEISVGGQVLSPRRQILSTMFANNSSYLQGAVPGSGVGNLPVIQADGHLLPSILSAPFPLNVTGTGSGYAIFAQNQNLAAGQDGILASGFSGLSATASGSTGVGVYGTALGSGGLGVKAEQNSASSVALLASNPSGMGAWLGGGIYGLGLSATNIGLQVGGSSNPLSGQSFSDPLTGIQVYASGTGINVNYSGNGNGIFSKTGGLGASILGQSNSASGTGVLGQHSPASGSGIGVQGTSASTNGTGVQGQASATLGVNYGVYGASGSPNGFGVYGTGPGKAVEGSATGTNVTGVAGLSNAPVGTGVAGQALGSGAGNIGVLGTVTGNDGEGVLGKSPSFGVYGESSGSLADSVGVYGTGQVLGVEGEAQQNSGSTVGVTGRSFSPVGTGVFGENMGSGAGNHIGVWGSALQSGGAGIGVLGNGAIFGVQGVVPGTTLNEYGIYGYAAGSGDYRYGVYGAVNSATPGEHVFAVFGEITGTANSGYGVFGNNNSPSGRGVHAYNVSAHTSQDIGYALGVSGKLQLSENNAALYSVSSGPLSSWTVFPDFCGSKDVVLIFPAVDISAAGTQANALWVQSVLDGQFTVKSALPVSNMAFYYLVISKP
jgi:hypothetical protein